MSGFYRRRLGFVKIWSGGDEILTVLAIDGMRKIPNLFGL